MKPEAGPNSDDRRTRKYWPLLIVGTFCVYYFSNPRPQSHFDYTFRIADALLHGRLGLIESPPSWLNEMVPHGGRYYSVFPLGSVLTMLPVALLKKLGFIKDFPAGAISALAAAATAYFIFALSGRYSASPQRRLLFSLSMLFGTWMWCNLAYAGAWQIALGFAVLGQAAALYFSLIRTRPLAAGFFFALAFGNRTEVLLTAPVFIYLLLRPDRGYVPAREETAGRTNTAGAAGPAGTARRGVPQRLSEFMRGRYRTLILFSLFPLALGALTLAYNYARFSSVTDFGYARIPGVLQEPWYRYGIFSLRAIPLNADKMLFEPWKRIGQYPYLVPTGFGGSIFLSCPLLLLLFRRGARDKGLKVAAWAAVAVITFALWCHGNPGGWQHSYRYAMDLLPWLFLILLENGPGKLSKTETALSLISIGINAYATYLFLWTDYVKP